MLSFPGEAMLAFKMGLDARNPDFGAFEQLVNLLRVKFQLVSVAEQTCLSLTQSFFLAKWP